DDESFVVSFEALFPPDLMQDATDWDLMTSMDFLMDFVNQFNYFHTWVYGSIEVEWDIEKINAGSLNTWERRARDFETHLEGLKTILGNEMRFVTSSELSQLFSSFKDEKEHFDITYLLLSLPLFLLVLLVLLEINRLGSESQGKEVELLHLNGVALREMIAILAIERFFVSTGSLLLGMILTPFFIEIAKALFPRALTIDSPNILLEALTIEICLLMVALVFLTSIPAILSSLRRIEHIGTPIKNRKPVFHQSILILMTILFLATILIIFSAFILGLPEAEEGGPSDLVFVGEHLRFAAFSIILLVAPVLIIRFLNRIYGKSGSYIWKSYTHKSTLSFQLYQEEAKYLARPALILFLALMLLVPSLVVTPSINAHLEEESQLAVGSSLIIENWKETIPITSVHNVSAAIEATSLVYHVFLTGRFPPLREQLSILVIDPMSFIKVANLELSSKGRLIPLKSINQLFSNFTMLVGAGCTPNIAKGDNVSLQAWETKEEDDSLHYIPHELDFLVVDKFDLFPLLNILTQAIASTEEINALDELIMSHGNWDIFSNISSLDSSITWSLRKGLMVGLNDPSKQESVARKLQETFGRTVRSIKGVKKSFESPFHNSYSIIGTTSLLVALIAALIVGAASANTLLNRRRDGFEVLLHRGMSRQKVTFLAAQEFGLAMFLPTILGLFLGLLYLKSMEGILSIYEGQLSFSWLLNPLVMVASALALILTVFLIWIGIFFLAISRHHFAKGED
ncbi:MAG: FtsX-like permease family protein, partial [Candidatus Hodarchaeota archaeon]